MKLTLSGQTKVKVPALLAAVVLATAAAHASAAPLLTFDLRFADGQGATDGGKTLALSATGTYTADVWAQLSGVDNLNNTDAFGFAYFGVGSLQGSGGAIATGGVTGVALSTLNASSGTSTGTVQNLTTVTGGVSWNPAGADGLKDVGGTSGTSTSGWILAKMPQNTPYAFSNYVGGTTVTGLSQQINANTWEIKLATVTLNAASLGTSGTTSFNVYFPTQSLGLNKPLQYWSDKSSLSAANSTQTTASVTFGSALTFALAPQGTTYALSSMALSGVAGGRALTSATDNVTLGASVTNTGTQPLTYSNLTLGVAPSGSVSGAAGAGTLGGSTTGSGTFGFHTTTAGTYTFTPTVAAGSSDTAQSTVATAITFVNHRTVTATANLGYVLGHAAVSGVATLSSSGSDAAYTRMTVGGIAFNGVASGTAAVSGTTGAGTVTLAPLSGVEELTGPVQLTVNTAGTIVGAAVKGPGHSLGQALTGCAIGGDLTDLYSTDNSGVTAQILEGTTLPTNVVSMAWRNPDAGNEPALTHGYLSSDVVDLTFSEGSPAAYVLAMSYTDPVAFAPYASLLDLEQHGEIFLISKLAGHWQNAVAANTGNLAGSDGTFVGLTSWQAFRDTHPGPLTSYMGDYGLDPATHTAWAVLNHVTEFSVAPEPASLTLLTPLALLLAKRRRT